MREPRGSATQRDTGCPEVAHVIDSSAPPVPQKKMSKSAPAKCILLGRRFIRGLRTATTGWDDRAKGTGHLSGKRGVLPNERPVPDITGKRTDRAIIGKGGKRQNAQRKEDVDGYPFQVGWEHWGRHYGHPGAGEARNCERVGQGAVRGGRVRGTLRCWICVSATDSVLLLAAGCRSIGQLALRGGGPIHPDTGLWIEQKRNNSMQNAGRCKRCITHRLATGSPTRQSAGAMYHACTETPPQHVAGMRLARGRARGWRHGACLRYVPSGMTRWWCGWVRGGWHARGRVETHTHGKGVPFGSAPSTHTAQKVRMTPCSAVQCGAAAPQQILGTVNPEWCVLRGPVPPQACWLGALVQSILQARIQRA
eukprot:TRINITY_DN2926_c0_g1_i1.p1 TRINITY_DN2926_c0_g1~~TRINITY_DN2926_c0_g1_i1.p1  ORF type:complete len:366 (-),score=-38.36 TRINITY_DN2926_c0_g1_i1:545-1642(-)